MSEKAVWDDLIDEPTRALLARREVPPFTGKRPVLVFIHGGGGIGPDQPTSYYYYHPWGWSSQGAHYAMMFKVHQLMYGSTEEQLGTVARTIRTKFLAVPGRVVNRSGRHTLRMPARWPWAQAFLTALERLRAIPLRI